MMFALRILLIWTMPCIALVIWVMAGCTSRRWNDIATWYFKSTVVFLVGIPVTLLGLIMVPLAYPFASIETETEAQFTDPRYASLGSWVRQRLPWFARLWDNAFDGLRGDKRGWFANWCIEHRIPYPSIWSAFVWAAIRNPANYWSRNITGCDVTGCTVETVFGPDVVDEDHPGFHMLIARTTSGRSYPVIEIVQPWPFGPSHAVFGRFGWKIKSDHAGTSPDSPPQDRIKGTVYRCSLWKKL